MRIENYLDLGNKAGMSGLFFACGSFGVIDGKECTRTSQAERTVYTYCDENIKLTATFIEMENGVVIRRDEFQNLSTQPQEISDLRSRFRLDGNAYEVYTQFSGWQHESASGWQTLQTAVTAASSGIRGCDSAAPVMALHNLFNTKTTVFHLLPNARWQMTARKFSRQEKEIVVVETGFCSDGLRLSVAPGETIHLPAVIFFSADNKTDLDAYKLHTVYHQLHPRKTLPVVYNSWLYCFDLLDIDHLLEQADQAAELGIEAFMVDAGWFGEGKDWSHSVGDWSENTQSGPKGRLAELSRHVRQKGMIFGLWFEPERADPQSNTVREHPEYYFNNIFLNFAKPEAVEYITEIISAQIKKYQIGWLKLDFNGTTPVDPSGDGFYRYYEGQRRFITTLKERFPHLYLTGCASGGYRMELEQGTLFDSLWLSDNQGPYEGIRIVKDTLKRMPSALIERWNVQTYCPGFPRYGQTERVGKMLSCNDATWDSVLNVEDSFTEGFLSGGPMGFSCDLAAFPDHYKQYWKEKIAAYKEQRSFYQSAIAFILADRDEICAIQYADRKLEQCVLQIFVKKAYADKLILYPRVAPEMTYLSDNEEISGKDLLENGLMISLPDKNDCKIIRLTAKKD